ncbi:type II toxin-antitoxin system PemI/MazE family antitoxin [Lacticaseibacillus zhaodongensis]|uniref:type II toxin-antitoxin system PemI/MazE family antitoxin n=1 Tax=Lacticaseibacillus zhaodongensis TaxID=2668065 RepID=UPI0012D319F7|nr:hypothetical protein [Lacticaseibacillus zhaodongensis]
MFEVKVVARGDSLVLSLPDNTGIDFTAGQHWLMIPTADGTAFTVVPKLVNPYRKQQSADKMPEEWSDVDWHVDE